MTSRYTRKDQRMTDFVSKRGRTGPLNCVEVRTANDVGDVFEFFLTENGMLYIVESPNDGAKLHTTILSCETLRTIVQAVVDGYPEGTFTREDDDDDPEDADGIS